jgi:hypothetical protein
MLANEPYIPRFEQLKSRGLVRDHANNLILQKSAARTRRRRWVIQIPENYLLKDIIHLIYGKQLEQHARWQAFMEAWNRFDRGDKDDKHLSESPFKPSFSFKTIGSLLRISSRKAHDVIKNLERLKYLRIEKQKTRLVHKNLPAARLEDLPGYRFNIDSQLFEKVANKYEFPHAEIYQPLITRSTYKKVKKHLQKS